MNVEKKASFVILNKDCFGSGSIHYQLLFQVPDKRIRECF